MDLAYVLAIPVTRDYASVDGVKYTRHLPSSGATFCVTKKTLLGHDGNSIACSTTKVLQYRVPNMSLILFL